MWTFVSDIAICVLKRDVKLQLTDSHVNLQLTAWGPGPDSQTSLGQTYDISYDNILWRIRRTRMTVLRHILRQYLTITSKLSYDIDGIENKLIKITYKQIRAAVAALMAVLWTCCALGRMEVQVRAGTGTNALNGYRVSYTQPEANVIVTMVTRHILRSPKTNFVNWLQMCRKIISWHLNFCHKMILWHVFG